MSKDKKAVVAAQGAATTPAVTPEPTPAVSEEAQVLAAQAIADEKKAEETATDVLAALNALGADGGEPNDAVVETLEADENEVEVDEWANAQDMADQIFEQYEDKNEVFVTIDAQGFWSEDMAASQNTKYRKFERQ